MKRKGFDCCESSCYRCMVDKYPPTEDLQLDMRTGDIGSFDRLICSSVKNLELFSNSEVIEDWTKLRAFIPFAWNLLKNVSNLTVSSCIVTEKMLQWIVQLTSKLKLETLTFENCVIITINNAGKDAFGKLKNLTIDNCEGQLDLLLDFTVIGKQLETFALLNSNITVQQKIHFEKIKSINLDCSKKISLLSNFDLVNGVDNLTELKLKNVTTIDNGGGGGGGVQQEEFKFHQLKVLELRNVCISLYKLINFEVTAVNLTHFVLENDRKTDDIFVIYFNRFQNLTYLKLKNISTSIIPMYEPIPLETLDIENLSMDSFFDARLMPITTLKTLKIVDSSFSFLQQFHWDSFVNLEILTFINYYPDNNLRLRLHMWPKLKELTLHNTNLREFAGHHNHNTTRMKKYISRITHLSYIAKHAHPFDADLSTFISCIKNMETLTNFEFIYSKFDNRSDLIKSVIKKNPHLEEIRVTK